MSSASTPRSQKALIEAARRESINERVEVLRALFLDPSKKMSLGEVLNRAALLLNGQDANTPMPSTPSSSPSTPGPIRTRKEVKKDREQCRRDLQVAGFDALQKFVLDNGLSTTSQLDRVDLLDIVIDEMKKRMSAPAAPAVVAPAPATPAPTPAVMPPPAAPALPVLPPSFFFDLMQLHKEQYLQYLNRNAIVAEFNEGDYDGIIDIIN